MTSTSHLAKDRIALCLSVNPPLEPAMRIPRFVDDVFPFVDPLTATPLLVRARFADLELILIICLNIDRSLTLLKGYGM